MTRLGDREGAIREPKRRRSREDEKRGRAWNRAIVVLVRHKHEEHGDGKVVVYC